MIYMYIIMTVTIAVMLLGLVFLFRDRILVNTMPFSHWTQRQTTETCSSTNVEFKAYSQQESTCECLEQATNAQKETKSSDLDTDALPVDPRDVTGAYESQHITELKESFTAPSDEELSNTSYVSSLRFTDLREPQGISEHIGEHYVEELKETNCASTCLNSVTTSCNLIPQKTYSSSPGDVRVHLGRDSKSDSCLAIYPECEPTSPSKTTPRRRNVIAVSSEDSTRRGEMKSQKSSSTIVLHHVLQDDVQSVQLSTHHVSMTDEETTQKEYMYQREVPTVAATGHPGETGQPLNLPLQEPPEQWEYNKLLVDLNNMIKTPDELDTMKDRFRSGCRMGSFGKRVIEGIKKPRDLFRKMEECNFLNENNIIYLQSIILELNRPELIEKTIDYCSKTDTVLHFLPPQENQVVNGFRYAKFHLFLDKVYTKREVTEMQSMVARILCVDEKYVLVVGVEPSNSLLVTIMLPDIYADILVKYLEQDLLHDRFASIDIDTITIDEKVYTIKVNQEVGVRSSDEQLLSLYRQLSSRDRQLEGMRNTCYQLQKELENMKKQDIETASQLDEPKQMHEQQVAHVGTLRKPIESDAIRLDMLEEQCIQKQSDLEEQLSSPNALLHINQAKYRHMEGRIKTLETQNDEFRTLITKLLIMELELSSMDNRNRKLVRNEAQLTNERDILLDYVTSVIRSVIGRQPLSLDN